MSDHAAATASVVPRVGEPFPAVLTLREVAPILGVSYRRAQALQTDGVLREFETATRLGHRILYSGIKLQAWAEDRALAHQTVGRRHWGGKHL